MRATRRPAHPSLNDTWCAPAHNTPLPLERSAPGSFKRLLGGNNILALDEAAGVVARCDVFKRDVALYCAEERYDAAAFDIWDAWRRYNSRQDA